MPTHSCSHHCSSLRTWRAWLRCLHTNAFRTVWKVSELGVSPTEVLPNDSMASPATKSKNGLSPAKGRFTGTVREDYLKMIINVSEIYTKVPAVISLKRGRHFTRVHFKKESLEIWVANFLARTPFDSFLVSWSQQKSTLWKPISLKDSNSNQSHRRRTTYGRHDLGEQDTPTELLKCPQLDELALRTPGVPSYLPGTSGKRIATEIPFNTFNKTQFPLSNPISLPKPTF